MGLTNLEMAFLILIIGGLLTSLMRSWRSTGWTATVAVGAATLLAWGDGLRALLGREPVQRFILPLPKFGSELAVALDPLGGAFLCLITSISFIATLYSVGYMQAYREEHPGRFYSLLQLFVAGMMGVVSVADWVFFIVFWELMTLTSFFLVTFERSNPQAVRAGFKYFIMTHVATIGLFITGIVLWKHTGSFAFGVQKAALSMITPSLRGFLLALYLLAFATKAGIFPMGDWVPDAYPAAPSGVSAIFSGVMSKLGAYGMLRIFWGALPEVGSGSEIVAWGSIITFLGALSAFVGGLTAMKEKDAKRLLAFSSISQAGYIFLALGIGVSFTASPSFSSIALLGVLGAGFHILNDAICKSLLFMNAGSVLYSTGTRDLNLMGGLSSVMPFASAAGLIGVASLSGLPPTNGFASKWLIYQSSISGGIQFAPFVAVAVVAFFASLSTLAYSLKYYGTSFLGKPAAGTAQAKAIPGTMSLAQGLLALSCIVIGLIPSQAIQLIGTLFDGPVATTFRITRTGGLATLPVVGAVQAFWSPVALALLFLAAFAIAEVIRRAGGARVRVVPTWYCGEEHGDDEVRYRAQGYYSPFNEVFARAYPRFGLPRLPSIRMLRSILDLDSWLYDPMLRGGGSLVDKVSRSHVGIPQLYLVWQVAGMIIVLGLLFVLAR